MADRAAVHRGRTDRPTPVRVLARVRVEDYGPGQIRPTSAPTGAEGGPLRLTRATRANLSPTSRCSTIRRHGHGRAGRRDRREPALGRATTTADRRPALADEDPATIAAIDDALASAELLDRRRPPPLRDRPRVRGGDRRRGPSPVRADVPGALEDPGLTVFPTHRLVARPAPRPARGARGRDRARLRSAPAREHRRPRPRIRASRSASATSTPISASLGCSRSRTRQSRTPRSRITPRRIGGSTLRYSRR